MCKGDECDNKSGSDKDNLKVSSKLKPSSQKIASVGNNAKQLLSKASVFVTKSPGLVQLGVGAASGWCTGFLTTKVGKTAAVTVGGTVILIAAAGQTGLININWDKLGKNMSEATNKVEQSMVKNAPKINAVRKYARTNTYFAAGFVGGFLLGLCS